MLVQAFAPKGNTTWARRLVGARTLPHNQFQVLRKMRRPIILILVVAAMLTGLAIGYAATRARRSNPAVNDKNSPHAYRAESAEPRKEPMHPSELSRDGDDGDVGEVIRFVSNPQPAPAFLLTAVAGNPVSTAQWKGKVVILNFWATWCPPCRAEIPMLIDLQSRYKDRLQIVGVSVDDAEPDEVEQFAKEAGMNYPVVMANRGLVQEYGGVPALPTAFVINPDTKVVQKHVGLFPEAMYEQEIRALLNLPVDVRVETFEDQGQIFLKNASLATALPGVDLRGLTEAQRKTVLKELNTKTCQCGCGLTLAQCRIVDSPCLVSKKLANEVVKQILSESSPPGQSANPNAPGSEKPQAPNPAPSSKQTSNSPTLP
jgi:thiol-disulfide isomerase/thioredoxin